MKDEREERLLHDLRDRLKIYSLGVIRLYSSIPRTTEVQVIGKQLIRSGTSPGAHYREACRGRSSAEFISKMEGALQELDESAYWLELLSDLWPSPRIQPLITETDELIRIFVTCVKNAKAR